MQFFVSFVFALAVTVRSAVTGGFRSSGAHLAQSVAHTHEFNHRLRVCNAYPYDAALDIYRGKTEKLTDEAMPYKGCKDFKSQLSAGDKLEFKIGDASAGTFSVSDLPNNDAVLLLVIYRHDTMSTACSFESHVFSNVLNAQIAVIDTYKGSAKSTIKILDDDSAKTARAEDLRFDSVVAVNPGLYKCSLDGSDGTEVDAAPLVALNRESYIVLRVGVEAQAGPSYPQEIVVYPRDNPKKLNGAASSIHSSALTVLAVILTASRWW